MLVASRWNFFESGGTALAIPLPIIAATAMAAVPTVTAMHENVHGDECNPQQNRQPICQ